ncbi:Paraquat-inducible protein B [Marinomonas aquimarina]|uniref:Paraquat-inducible protein B n=1 Tax=Marinomonas aquimarina TaxID=295068 RepID=A0A1A8TI43_9GAMM|nr:intermembrane transport protein PqiB [Marinomonas aquimarina]SBS32413.1 Paraquat-inducible protein B [Marinomonas aquimarina]
MSLPSDQGHKASQALPATIRSNNRISKIWIIPILTLVLSLWFILQEVNDKGIEIEIEFQTASGLEAGKTQIKIRDVVIGHVDSIALNDDSSGVRVTALLDNKAEKFLRSDTRFWVVSPRVSFEGISGLQTLLSGSYIDMAPGIDEQTSRQFVALEDPPVTPIGTPGLRVFLNSEKSFTAKVGDQVIYRGLSVGRIETVEYDLEKRLARYSAFIEAPFDKLVTSNTRFWNTSGIELELGADGVGVTTPNLEALIAGGITFDEPEDMPPSQSFEHDKVFQIYPSYKSAMAHRYVEKVYYLILIESSVRGLKEGAPVEYRGLQIGQVEDINIKLDDHKMRADAESYKIPVLISIQPGRANLSDDETGRDFISKQFTLWVENGLRASLKTGSLLTGAVFVDLKHDDKAEDYKTVFLAGYPLIPTIPDEIVQFTDQLSTTLDKINELPLQGVAEDLRVLLQDLSTSANAFNQASSSISGKLDEFDMAAMNATLSSLNDVLEKFATEDNGVSTINQTMVEIQNAMRELTPLLQKMNTAPNSLIFKSQVAPDIEPQGARR